jgi:hypothetical protein
MVLWFDESKLSKGEGDSLTSTAELRIANWDIPHDSLDLACTKAAPKEAFRTALQIRKIAATISFAFLTASRLVVIRTVRIPRHEPAASAILQT